MNNISIGFIGGGRITKILLQGWKRVGKLPAQVVVMDLNSDMLERLKKDFPTIKITVNDPKLPAECDVVFIALHPPALVDTIRAIKPIIKPSTGIVSLAPKIKIVKIAEILPECKNIVRINPNAPSIVNAGYNPMAFSKSIGETEKKTVVDLFRLLGDCPEVPEELLEAFAMTTAMGPTYFWFQIFELQELAKSFGIPEDILKDAIPKMVIGTVKTITESGMTQTEVMDLIPVKPLVEEEPIIKEFYQKKLNALYKKLKG